MDKHATTQAPFTLMSDETLPSSPLFTGVAFPGPNTVIGQEGHHRYIAAGNSPVQPNEDGCYTVATPHKDGILLGTDFKGTAKLFYYKQGSRWGVSNSFYALVEAARKRGWETTPNLHTLSPIPIATTLWQGLHSPRTAIAEVSLAPRQAMLLANHSGLRVVPPEVEQRLIDEEEYGHRLKHFVEVCTGRLAGLVQAPGTSVVQELTGGLDSRTNLSLLLAARQYLGVDLANVQFKSNDTPGRPADMAAAREVARRYHLEISSSEATTALPIYLSGGDQAQAWLSFAFGSYFPMYSPGNSRRLDLFPVGGQGGEGHRVAYSNFETPEQLIDAFSTKFERQEDYSQVRRDFLGTISYLRETYPETPPLLAHFTDFRERLHSGLHAQYRPRVLPLASRHFYAATRALGEDALLRGQAPRDIHALTAPGLMMVPYETAEKSPSETVLQSLARPQDLQIEAGKVFGDVTGSPDAAKPAARPQFWDIIGERLEIAAARLPSNTVPTGTLERARTFIQEFPHARRAVLAMPVHHVLLADYVLNGEPN